MPNAYLSASFPLNSISKEKLGAVKQNHIGILDLLRGVAALSVLLLHFISNRGLAKLYSASLMPIFQWGNMGVDIFFVISGFIIPYSIWGKNYRIQEFGRFILKRIVRIAPPAYICVILILLQWIIVDYFIKHNEVSRLTALTFEQVMRNILFQYSLLDPKWINPVFWTLAIEFQFYVFIGLAYSWIFERGSILAFITGFLFLTLGYYVFHFSRYSFSGYAPHFASGGVTLLYMKKAIKLWKYLLVLALSFLMAVHISELMTALFGLGTALIIAFARVRNPVFAFFGKISFSLYLTHLLVGGITEFILVKLFHPQTELANVGAILVCIAAAIAFAYVFYRLVEIPFMRLAKRLNI
jgi:peptidoglycan/LPS O-acetylase OafA/YrhL